LSLSAAAMVAARLLTRALVLGLALAARGAAAYG
jgi:hypothetical protein